MFVCIWKQVRRALLCDRCRCFFDYSPHRDMLKCNADITIPKLNVIIVYHNSYLHVLMSTEKMCMWDILFPRILTEPIKQTTRWAWRKVCVTTGCVSSWPDVLTYKHIYYQLSNARISSHQWLCKCCLKKVKKEMTLHFANSWHKNKDKHLQQAFWPEFMIDCNEKIKQNHGTGTKACTKNWESCRFCVGSAHITKLLLLDHEKNETLLMSSCIFVHAMYLHLTHSFPGQHQYESIMFV